MSNGEQDTESAIHDNGSTAGPLPPPKGIDNVDDLLAEFNRIPLFMTSLDDTNGADGSNPQLDALKALQYEGTKYEIANNFREQGNECARAKDWRNARDFYTQALDVLSGKADKLAKPPENVSAEGELTKKLEGDVGCREVDWLDNKDQGADTKAKVIDLEEEAKKEKQCEELCFANRAQCNLQLQNYGMAVRDCLQALKLNPSNTKALYRSAQALLALSKPDAALQAITIGSNVSSRQSDTKSQASFEALEEVAATQSNRLATLRHEQHDREQRKRKEAATLAQALKQRGIVQKSTGQAPELEDAEVALEDALDANSELRTPVLLLYPTAGQSELVKAVKESETMGDVLSMVLPVPFEQLENSEFGGPDGSKVDCFVDTGTGGLRKVGKRVEWQRVIEKGGAVVRDGLIALHVVPKTKVEGWIADWKKMNRR